MTDRTMDDTTDQPAPTTGATDAGPTTTGPEVSGSGAGDETPSGASSPGRGGRLRSLLTREPTMRLLELVGAWGIAIVQPTLSVLGSSVDVFIGGSFAFPILYGLTLALGLPLLLWVTELVATRLSAGIGTWLHRTYLGVLIAVFALQMIAPVAGRAVTIAAGVAVLVGVVVLLRRFGGLTRFFRYLAPAVVIFLALFLFASDVTPVIVGTAGNEAYDVPIAKPYPVVFITFDELATRSLLGSNGQIDGALFPSFAALAKETTWFRNNASVTPATSSSIPAMLTGNYPKPLTPPLSGNFPDSLFTYLGSSYELRVQESATQLCAPSLCRRWDGGSASIPSALNTTSRIMTKRLFPPTEAAAPKKGPALEDEAGDNKAVPFHDPIRLEGFTAELTPTEVARVDFAHFVLPHFPWEFTSSGRKYEDDNGWLPRGLFAFAWTSDWAAEQARLRHLLQLQFVDAELGKMMAQMKASGLWDQAIVVVTADHGVSFQRGEPFRGVSAENTHEMLWAPLFVKGPGLTPGTVSQRPSSQLDILPTLADMLGTPLPWPADGTSLLKEAPTDGSVRRVYSWGLDTLKPTKGSYAEFDGAASYRRLERPGASGSGPRDDLYLYRVGPHAALVGRSVDGLVAEPVAGSVTVDGPGRTRSFDPADGTVEAAFSAHTSDLGVGTDVAVVLNGTIVAVAPVENPDGKDPVIWALLPETRFQAGDNTIETYVVTGRGPSARLHPVGG